VRENVDKEREQLAAGNV